MTVILTNINETSLPEDPYILVDMSTLPDIMSSTESSISILETLGAPIPPALLHTPVIEVPIPNFATIAPYATYPAESFFDKYEPQPTDGSLCFTMKIVGNRSLAIPGHAIVKDALIDLFPT